MPDLRIVLVDGGTVGTPKAAPSQIAGAGSPVAPGQPAASGAPPSPKAAAAQLANQMQPAQAPSAAGNPAGGGSGAAPTDKQVIDKAVRDMSMNIRAADEGFEKLASNDNGGAVKGAVDGIASMVMAMGPVGAVVGGVVKVFSTLTSAVGDVVTSFVERGKQLQAYSPELAQANTMVNIRSMFADMREAQELGPEMARLMTVR